MAAIHLLPRLSLIAIVACACAAVEPVVKGAGPRITLLDSTLIAQPDLVEGFLQARTQTITSRGELLMETGTSILHFDTRGRLLHAMGRKGSGPGEFMRISTIVLLPGDSLVAAFDYGRRLSVFGLNDGKLRRQVRVAMASMPAQEARFVGDTIVLPAKASAKPFMSWLPVRDSLWYWGVAPPGFRNAYVAYLQGLPSAARHSEGWLALFPADASLFLLRHNGTPVGLVGLPVRRRVGVPPDLAARVKRLEKSGKIGFAASLALSIHQRPDGSYQVIHLDSDVDVDQQRYDPATGQGVVYSNMRYWISLVSADLSHACVDALIPVTTDAIVVPVSRGNDVHFLVRGEDNDGRLRTVLRSFAVSPAGCDWTSTGGVRPAP